MNRNPLYKLLIVLIGLILLVSACTSNPDQGPTDGDDRLKIVVTTTFIGDVVSNIAGDSVNLITLLEPGQNPHSFQPTPQDLVKVSDADLIFVNGLGLEEFLDDLLVGADAAAPVIVVSEGISALSTGDHQFEEEEDNDHQSQTGQDPHVWFDPNNILVWTDNITRVLVANDPKQAEIYKSNAAVYQNELIDLDSWIREQLDLIPPENQKLVTDHISFSYFTEQYGLDLVGAVIPAITTEAKTSGQQLADLIDTIRENNVRAIFVGVDFDPTLSHRIAEDLDVELVPLYFGSLSDGNPAGTYLDFMRYNVDAIVKVLR